MSNFLVLTDDNLSAKYILSEKSVKENTDGKFEWVENHSRLVVSIILDYRSISQEYIICKDNDYQYVLSNIESNSLDLPEHGFLVHGWKSYIPSMFRLPTIPVDSFRAHEDWKEDVLAIFRSSEKINSPLLPGSGGNSDIMKVEEFAPYSYLSDQFGLAYYNEPIVFDSSIVFNQGLFVWESLQMQRLSPTKTSLLYDFMDQKVYFSFLGRQVKLKKIGLLLYACNYGHWFTQNFPALHAFRRLIDNGTVAADEALIVTRGLSKFQLRVFELFGLGHIDVLDVASPHTDRLQLDAAFLPTSCMVDHRFAWSSYLSDAFNSIRPRSNPESPRYIFVSRKDVGNKRGLRNEDELLSTLKQAGFDFTPIEAANYSFDEQREIFSNAHIVIGPHGSGLNNLMWAPRGRVGIELIHDGMIENRCWFYHQLTMAGYQYGVINAKRDHATEAGIDDTMHVEPEMLVNLVKQAASQL